MSTMVTIDTALSLMLNFDYIPEGLTLEEMLRAFHEEAEVDYENALGDEEISDIEVHRLQNRWKACGARLELFGQYRQALEDTFSDAYRGNSLNLNQVEDWAADTYGIQISRQSSHVPQDPELTWEDLTVEFRPQNKIAFCSKDGKRIAESLQEIGLWDNKTNTINHQAGILLGLAQQKKFPSSPTLENKHKTAVSKIRRALKKLTGIEGDPFHPYNPTDGFKPRFKLVDKRNVADERAKREASFESFDDNRPYMQEEDEAGDWLRKND